MSETERYLIVDVAYYVNDASAEMIGEGWEPTMHWLIGGDWLDSLTITDDTEAGEEYEDIPDIATRKFVGIVPQSVARRLMRDWSLDPRESENNMGMLTEVGFMPGYRWNADGMDWNVGGWSPIAFADISISCALRQTA